MNRLSLPLLLVFVGAVPPLAADALRSQVPGVPKREPRQLGRRERPSPAASVAAGALAQLGPAPPWGALGAQAAAWNGGRRTGATGNAAAAVAASPGHAAELAGLQKQEGDVSTRADAASVRNPVPKPPPTRLGAPHGGHQAPDGQGDVSAKADAASVRNPEPLRPPPMRLGSPRGGHQAPDEQGDLSLGADAASRHGQEPLRPPPIPLMAPRDKEKHADAQVEASPGVGQVAKKPAPAVGVVKAEERKQQEEAAPLLAHDPQPVHAAGAPVAEPAVGTDGQTSVATVKGPSAGPQRHANSENATGLDAGSSRGVAPDSSEFDEAGGALEENIAEALSRPASWPRSKRALALLEATPTAWILWFASIMAFVALAAVPCAFLAGLTFAYGRQRFITGTRQKAEAIRVSQGAEIRSIFALRRGGGGPRAPPGQPLSPGMLLRVQGRVISRPEGTLVAPFTSRPCVMYSASVSHQRHDGVHQPPVAYHSAGTDFIIVLLDAPDVSLAVQGPEAQLFDMVTGIHSCEKRFSEAPEAWRGFALAHLGSNSELPREVSSHIDLSGEGAPLEFKECALLAGATVTVIGEISRDRSGGLVMHAWQAESVPMSNSSPSSFGAKADLWRATTWERGGMSSRDAPRFMEGLRGQLLISDDPELLDVVRAPDSRRWPGAEWLPRPFGAPSKPAARRD